MALLRFLRIPGVFTAWADVLAGYLLVRFAGAGEGDIQSLPFVLAASASLYMAGMAWNDVFDADEDRRTRPERPIPAGLIRPSTGFLLSALLSVAGLLLAMTAGYQSFVVAGLLLALILLYDAGAKRVEVLGPTLMGACRGLNLLLGMTVHAQAQLLLGSSWFYLPPLLLAGYTVILTVVASLETPAPVGEEAPTDGRPAGAGPSGLPAGGVGSGPSSGTDIARPLAAGLLGLGAAGLLLVPLIAMAVLPGAPLALVLFLLLDLMLIGPGIRAVRTQSPAAVRAFVGTAIVGMVLLDAGFVASLTSPSGGTGSMFGFDLPPHQELAGVVLVAAMALPALFLRRRIAVT